MAALRLKERYGCKVVTDIMDAWPETLLQATPRGIENGKWRMANILLCAAGRIALRPYERMLRRACRESDAVSAQSEAFAQFARQNGASGDIHVCYLGAERGRKAESRRKEESGNWKLESGRKAERRSNADNLELELPRSNSKLNLLYLGAMGRSYDLETIIKAMRLLRDQGVAVECTFVGDGEKRARMEAEGVPGVRFTGFLSGEALEGELKQADLGLVPFFRESGVAVPYKAGDYLAYGLPLLSTIKGELEALINQHQCGQVYEPLNAAGLATAVRVYLDDPTRLAQARAGARACYEERFDRGVTYPEWAEWIAEL